MEYTLPFSNSPWVKLEGEAFARLAEGRRPHVYSAKSHIIRREQQAKNLYLVARGRVLLSINGESGQDKTLMIAEEGCIFGESGAILSVPTFVNAKAITEVTLYTIPGHQFQDLVRQGGDLAWHIVQALARKTRLLSGQVEMLSFDRPSQRVQKILIWLVQAHGEQTPEGVLLRVRLTQQNIADLAGLSRVSVAQVFAWLYDSGILRKQGGTFLVPDPDRLYEQWGG